MHDRLLALGPLRALVFGNFGEVSVDVHRLLELAADLVAQHSWRFYGARSAGEVKSFVLERFRRRVSLVATRAFARALLRRRAFVGVLDPAAVPRLARGAEPVARAPALSAFFVAQAYYSHLPPAAH